MARSRRLTELAAPALEAASAALTGGTGVVALSGGADSAAALWACAQVSSVSALHIDHGWPGSSWLRRAAHEVAAAIGVPIAVMSVEAGSSELAARIARYEAFAEVDGVVITAHTADDVAETVIANLGRGAGLDGLSGIPSSRPGIVRPFLDLRRQDLRELATLAGLPWLDDPANADPAFTRVRVRAMLRTWERSLDRPIVGSMYRTARTAGREAEFVDQRSTEVPIITDGRVVAIPLPPLRTVDPVLARRALRRALRVVDGPYGGSSHDVEMSYGVALGGPPVEVAGAITVRRRGGRLEFVTRAGDDRPAPTALEVGIPGRIRFGGWAIDVRATTNPPITLAGSRLVEVFDRDAIGEPLVVEPVSSSHRLRMRDGRHKSAIDALAERGVTGSDRSGWPILIDATGEPLWVPDVRRAALGWVTGDTRRYLVATASQEERWTPVGY